VQDATLSADHVLIGITRFGCHPQNVACSERSFVTTAQLASTTNVTVSKPPCGMCAAAARPGSRSMGHSMSTMNGSLRHEFIWSTTLTSVCPVADEAGEEVPSSRLVQCAIRHGHVRAAAGRRRRRGFRPAMIPIARAIHVSVAARCPAMPRSCRVSTDRTVKASPNAAMPYSSGTRCRCSRRQSVFPVDFIARTISRKS